MKVVVNLLVSLRHTEEDEERLKRARIKSRLRFILFGLVDLGAGVDHLSLF